MKDDGTPKIVYHGTNADFTVFKSKDGVYWFSESEDYAEAMMEERGGGVVMPVYLNMRNPYVTSLPPGKFSDPTYEAPIISKAKSEGYDGVIIENDTDNELAYDKFYVVFKPEQIKSAVDNRGTFDIKNEDIYYSKTDADFEKVTAKEMLKTTDEEEFKKQLLEDLLRMFDERQEASKQAERATGTEESAFGTTENISSKDAQVTENGLQKAESVIDNTEGDLKEAVQESRRQSVSEVVSEGEKSPKTAGDQVFKETSEKGVPVITTRKRMSEGQIKKMVADGTRDKVYSRKDAGGILESLISKYVSKDQDLDFGALQGKPFSTVVKDFWKKLNTVDKEKRRGMAERFADYILKCSTMKEIFENSENAKPSAAVGFLDSYLKRVDLQDIRTQKSGAKRL